ncbi:FAD-binding oxidoreductase [Reichenbachiella ulvae]|uniref:FAD-binding oxidoreductase n=1 Tax=Reichenbachiella ulvae TaxID=2980104 RepID=A0ABT3D0X9_9BACT|nr:FAD-binding oxidoreductase [Reichenbachiella ulvae]MCV9389468.1 FAD-binding oxidoreductase [Reichenbachiella ulvae]
MKKEISNWNNYPKRSVELVDWKNDGVAEDKTFIARGLGRCYGDAAIGDLVYSTLKHDLILSFDSETGEIVCQSGVSFETLLDVFVPKGWFLPVTPGTKYITVGGALASDVHGKNHHVMGCFGDHVSEISLILSSGEEMICSPSTNSEVFEATRGGMGLTGIINTVSFKLIKVESSYIKQKQIKASNLKEIIRLFEENKDATYSMAWIDCLKGGDSFGRSIFISGEHAKIDELDSKTRKNPLAVSLKGKLTMPFYLPGFVLNKLSIKAFNWLYYNKNIRKVQENVVHYDGFYYPLDSILHWNKMYGKKGFVQYQFVLPLENSEEGLIEILGKIRAKGWGSFLAVLKLFGDKESFISFPMEGYTLALDFPIKPGLFEFLDELDEIVASYGGRIYLSKDARMRPNIFKDNYPNAKKFEQIVKEVNPKGKVNSDLGRRLEIVENL